jgi:hypothetical protein
MWPAAAPADEANLVEFGTRVRFRHPLVRSVVYGSALPRERQQVHGALAEATDPQEDPDRRAWRRANAAPGPDEEGSCPGRCEHLRAATRRAAPPGHGSPSPRAALAL